MHQHERSTPSHHSAACRIHEREAESTDLLERERPTGGDSSTHGRSDLVGTCRAWPSILRAAQRSGGRRSLTDQRGAGAQRLSVFFTMGSFTGHAASARKQHARCFDSLMESEVSEVTGLCKPTACHWQREACGGRGQILSCKRQTEHRLCASTKTRVHIPLCSLRRWLHHPIRTGAAGVSIPTASVRLLGSPSPLPCCRMRSGQCLVVRFIVQASRKRNPGGQRERRQSCCR